MMCFGCCQKNTSQLDLIKNACFNIINEKQTLLFVWDDSLVKLRQRRQLLQEFFHAFGQVQIYFFNGSTLQ